jgi:hypothetical protein
MPPPARLKQLAAALEMPAYDLLERTGWSGAAARAALTSLDEPGATAATSRWRAELIELLPQLRGADVRALLAVAKRMVPEARE